MRDTAVTSEELVPVMSRAEARSLTDEVKDDAERLWRKLVELYEGGAHVALGYSSWSAYFKDEFGGSRSHSYRLLDAGRVARSLESVPDPGLNVEKAAALAPLKNDPESLRETWAEVVQLNPEPTAANVREAVQQKVSPKSDKATLNANAAKRKLYDVLSSVSGYCAALPDFNLERALSTASDDDIAAWDRLAGDAVRNLNTLRRAVKETR